MVLYLLFLGAASIEAGTKSEIRIPAGHYLPFYALPKKSSKDVRAEKQGPVRVESFWLDDDLVSQGDFLEFVRGNPKWRKSQVPRIFADESYLKNWKSDLLLAEAEDERRPVIRVSWFAAQAYCESRGRSLPTVDQWEYAFEDNGRATGVLKRKVLEWYSKPNPRHLPLLPHLPPNGFGIRDLHSVVWEWTLDFNSAMLGAELRSDGTLDESLFCGGGSAGARDPADYARFMRYSYRSSLKARFTTENLGFRCARNGGAQ